MLSINSTEMQGYIFLWGDFLYIYQIFYIQYLYLTGSNGPEGKILLKEHENHNGLQNERL